MHSKINCNKASFNLDFVSVAKLLQSGNISLHQTEIIRMEYCLGYKDGKYLSA